MTFGQKIKEIRKEKGMSIVELSEKSGISKVAIVSYEKNRIIPRPISILKLAVALNVNYENLYDLAQGEKNETNK